MKKYLFTLCAICTIVVAGFSQNILKLHKTDNSVVTISADLVDSIKFSNSQSALDVYQLSGLSSFLISEVDSITFDDVAEGLPSIETVLIQYQRGSRSISCMAKVSDVGGSDLIERGVCWSTAPNPTIKDSKLAHASARKGTFVVETDSVDVNMVYYARPYAVNASGVTYGVETKLSTMMGNVTYTFSSEINPTDNPRVYSLIKTAMDSACYYYNRYTSFEGNVWVYYSTGIPTAQASYRGSLGFGANERYMWVGTAMHEMAHYFGSGTTDSYRTFMATGVYTGPIASALLKSLTGETLKGDSQHFWPYGINQKEEITNLGSAAAQKNALIIHTKLVEAMRLDCGWIR